ncbi:hypothetical protein [Dactylosporangium sp. NPDC048998]|uniref:hypothetical protein n=1 Tax=Dactylosporangium sp. NPDC048998 TaxID=3363976 RepID=UPI00371E2E93
MPAVIVPPGAPTAPPATVPPTRPATVAVPSVIAPPGMAGPSSASAAPARTGQARFARDSTRYLCAAAQTDSSFSRKLLDGVIDEPYRAVASSPGVDLVTVLKYALAARRRHFARDLAIVLAVLVSALLSAAAPPIILLSLPLAWAAVFIEQLAAHGVVARRLRRAAFDPAAAPEPTGGAMRRRLTDIGQRDRGNASVFSDYAPFVGYGTVTDSWSFALNVARAAPTASLTPFTTSEVYAAVARDLAALDLPGVGVEQRVFVSGVELLDAPDPRITQELLPVELAAPLPDASDGLIRHLMEHPEGRARCYLSVRVTGWSGELVLTTFVRFALYKSARTLYVEASHCLLTPVKPRYRAVDSMRESPTIGQIARTASLSGLLTLPYIAKSFAVLAAAATDPLRRWQKRRNDRRNIAQERTHNYGPLVSPRELASDRRYFAYFQQQDKEMYSKVVERRVMESLRDFLDAHGIDTSELSERQTAILNNGVIVTGNASVNSGSIAAGAGAVARTVNTARRLVPGAPPAAATP